MVVGLGAVRRRDDRRCDLRAAPLRLAALCRRCVDQRGCPRGHDGECGGGRHQQRLGLCRERLRSVGRRRVRPGRNHSLAHAPRGSAGGLGARRGRAGRRARHADHRSPAIAAADLCRVGERHGRVAGLRDRSRRWRDPARVARDDRRCGARAGQSQRAGAVSGGVDNVAAGSAQSEPDRRHTVRAVRQLSGPERWLVGGGGHPRGDDRERVLERAVHGCQRQWRHLGARRSGGRYKRDGVCHDRQLARQRRRGTASLGRLAARVDARFEARRHVHAVQLLPARQRRRRPRRSFARAVARHRSRRAGRSANGRVRREAGQCLSARTRSIAGIARRAASVYRRVEL